MKKKVLNTVFLCVDAVVIILVALAAFTDVFTVDHSLWNTGVRKFVFYTVDSNVIAALFLLIAYPFKVRRLVTGRPLPVFTAAAALVGSAAVSVTFMTVLLFLGPTMGYGGMYVGNNLLLHLICPVLCVLSFICDTYAGKKLSFAFTPLSAVPTAIYAVVYYIMVMVIGRDNGGWGDFYGFNIGGRWYVSFAGMIVFAYGLGALLWLLHRQTEKKALG